MKKRISYFCLMALLGISAASAFDLKDILKGASSGEGSQAADIVSGIVNTLTATKIEYKDLTGSWGYNAPAVSFTSDNLMQKAGGVAASGAIVNKLKPYYAKAGITGMTIEFGADSTFVAKTARLTVRGTVQPLDDSTFKFNIKALGKIPAGSINAYAERQGTNVCITFDAKKLIKLAETIASLSGNATLKTASDLLNSYEGINIGVSLKKK